MSETTIKPGPFGGESEDPHGIFNSIVDWNLAVRQQRLERELPHLRETARLRERQPLLLKQRYGKLLL